jgi:hypothetical protein
MSIQSICRYIFTLTISVLILQGTTRVYAQTDTSFADTVLVGGNAADTIVKDTVAVVDTVVVDTASIAKKKKKDLIGHQLNLGVDIFHPILNNVLTDRYAYEAAGDYYLGNDYYIVAEGGWGGCKANYTDLKYTTTNNFLRLGFNRSVLARDNPKDWDMMLIGIRFGAAGVNRSPATYIIVDSLWGNSNGSSLAKSFNAYWVELTGGVRVELAKGLCAGWNIRAKFLMNGKSFQDLQPLYIAGFGKGDKNAIFDFNMYLSYSLRWRKKDVLPEHKKTAPPPVSKTKTDSATDSKGEGMK